MGSENIAFVNNIAIFFFSFLDVFDLKQGVILLSWQGSNKVNVASSEASY